MRAGSMAAIISRFLSSSSIMAPPCGTWPGMAPPGGGGRNPMLLTLTPGGKTPGVATRAPPGDEAAAAADAGEGAASVMGWRLLWMSVLARCGGGVVIPFVRDLKLATGGRCCWDGQRDGGGWT